MTTAVNQSPVNHPAPAADEAPTEEQTIPMLREQIDALDAAIIRIVAERARVSSRIQTARMNAGGTRVELGRERSVLANYRDGVGAHGPALAEAILQVCRGAR